MEKLSELEENYGDGWIKLYRSVIYNKIWLAEKFTKGQAWVDLLMLAKHKDGMFMQRDVIVNYKRGDITEGIINLSKRWKWSRTKTQNYLDFLEKMSQIRQQKSTVITVISIVNYNTYQQTGQQKDSRKTAERQQKDTHKKEKNEKNVKNIKDIGGEIAFDEFWNLYDKKIDRPTCERKWMKLSFDDQEAIMEFIPSYKKSQPDKQYRKHPATFLNNRSWENEIIENGDNTTFEQMSIEEHNRKILERYKVTL